MKNYLSGRLKLETQRGVTLIEMAVVVSIIALLLAGVLGGTNLYQASKLRRISTEIIQYDTAIKTFKEEYHYWPGDFPQAVAFWTATVTNGNGDGAVSFTTTQNDEDLYAWAHLASSEIITGQYSGVVTSAGATHYTNGINLPSSSAFKPIIFALFSSKANNYMYENITGLRIRITSLDGNGLPWEAGASSDSLSSKEAQAVDIKIDDGVADTGVLITYTHGNCTTAAYPANSADYNLTSTSKDCIMEWYVDRF